MSPADAKPSAWNAQQSKTIKELQQRYVETANIHIHNTVPGRALVMAALRRGFQLLRMAKRQQIARGKSRIIF
jgi:hypothetical protein